MCFECLFCNFFVRLFSYALIDWGAFASARVSQLSINETASTPIQSSVSQPLQTTPFQNQGSLMQSQGSVLQPQTSSGTPMTPLQPQTSTPLQSQTPLKPQSLLQPVSSSNSTQTQTSSTVSEPLNPTSDSDLWKKKHLFNLDDLSDEHKPTKSARTKVPMGTPSPSNQSNLLQASRTTATTTTLNSIPSMTPMVPAGNMVYSSMPQGVVMMPMMGMAQNQQMTQTFMPIQNQPVMGMGMNQPQMVNMMGQPRYS